MNKIELIGLTALILVNLTTAKDAYSDRRSYVWTYEYMTMPKRMWELEHYTTSEVVNINKSNVNTLKQWLELEYGITDNWDVALYQMWKIKNKRFDDDSEYDGFKLRIRYRFGKKGDFFVDPLIYVEYIRDDDFHKPNVAELKLILAKDIERFNISYNQIFKRNLASEGTPTHEYSAGINYELNPKFKLGIEAKGNYTSEKYALGPVVSFAKGKYWAALGSVFGLNKRTDDIQTRLIIGVLF
ncbi:MAG: hypothetical protein AABY43_05440 [Candidatus Omnitrophota bacterium]